MLNRVSLKVQAMTVEIRSIAKSFSGQRSRLQRQGLAKSASSVTRLHCCTCFIHFFLDDVDKVRSQAALAMLLL